MLVGVPLALTVYLATHGFLRSEELALTLALIRRRALS
jgi:hypothetical protein